MKASILECYRLNINRYKAIIAKKKDEYTRSDVNDLNVFFFIIHEMYKKYGCGNCGLFKCTCEIMPDKHHLVSKRICRGSPDWYERK